APDTLSGQDFFVEAEVDNPTPYLGQQVTYTFRFYQGLNLLDQPRYTPPPFTGFWNRKQPEQTQYTIHAGQRAYRVTELRTLLFPTIAGETTIEPAELTIPGGPFQTGQSLHTRPATVNVQPLPPGAPPDFNGAVGQFNLTASLDATKGTVNEPLTLRVTLSGQGNIESLPLPNWPDLPNWRTFESKATTNTRFENGQLSGSRIFERLLVPAAPGQFTIPAITYPYFDPLAGEYRTAAAGPISVTIVPAADEPPIPAPPGSAKEAVERLASDIRHIKPVPALLQSAPPPVTTRPGYWLAWGVPPVLLAANYLWQRRQARRRRHSALFRSLQAQKRALKALALARKQRQDPYASGGQILTAYLSDKLNRPVGGLTRTELEKILAAKGVPPAHLARLNACLLESDTGRYSPAAAGPDRAQRLLNQIETLINELETSFTG
ncbi:MAG: BatD family protein, partial [Anaerolineae bacterium]